jgi:hypothetical protein
MISIHSFAECEDNIAHKTITSLIWEWSWFGLFDFRISFIALAGGGVEIEWVSA